MAVVSAAARRDDEAHALRVALAVHHRHAGAHTRCADVAVLSAALHDGRNLRRSAADDTDAAQLPRTCRAVRRYVLWLAMGVGDVSPCITKRTKKNFRAEPPIEQKTDIFFFTFYLL